ncbi:hypothetical protein FGO68_gene10651 [Halteria grandinella]|uniref:Uncharacterized protein n=1 Tax=Halteria grandinella TaxID=5974 RepID=A0A8J8T6M2_HALGN|nr:hypothetical protein FGO68_gene10651 [Halteria grandinella]
MSSFNPLTFFLTEVATSSMVNLECNDYQDEMPLLRYVRHHPNPLLKVDKFDFHPNDCHDMSYYDKEGVSDFFKWLAKTNIRLLVQKQSYTRYKLAQLIEIKKYCRSLRKIDLICSFQEKDIRMFFQDTIDNDLVRKLYGFIKEEGHQYTDEEYIEIFKACDNDCLILDEIKVGLPLEVLASFLSRVRPKEKLTVHLYGKINQEGMKQACRVISILKKPPFSLFSKKLKIQLSNTYIEALEEFQKLEMDNKYLVERVYSFKRNDKNPTENLSSMSDAQYVEYAKILRADPSLKPHPMFGIEFLTLDNFPYLLRYLRLIHRPIVEVDLEHLELEVSYERYRKGFYDPLLEWHNSDTINTAATDLKIIGPMGYVIPFIRGALKVMPNLRNLEVDFKIMKKCIAPDLESEEPCKDEEVFIGFQFKHIQSMIEQRKGLTRFKVISNGTHKVTKEREKVLICAAKFTLCCLIYSRESMQNLSLENISHIAGFLKYLQNSQALQHLQLSYFGSYFELDRSLHNSTIEKFSNYIASFKNLQTFSSRFGIMKMPLDSLLTRMLQKLDNLIKINFEKLEEHLDESHHLLFLDALSTNKTLRDIESSNSCFNFKFKHIKAILERKPTGCQLKLSKQYLTLKEYVLLQRVTNYKYILLINLGTFTGEEERDIDEEPYPDLSKLKNEEEKIERLKRFWKVDSTYKHQMHFNNVTDAEYEEAMIEHIQGVAKSSLLQEITKL